MFGLSFAEVIIIFLVALIVVGPDKLPELAQKVGRFSAKFKKTTNSYRKEFYNSIFPPGQEIKKELNNLSSELKAIKSSIKDDISTKKTHDK